MHISDSNIIITGAGNGMGRSMARHFSSLGAQVIALDLDEEALSSLSIENPAIKTHVCDVSEAADVDTITADIFEANQKVNVLINNAGIMKNAPLVNLLSRPERRHSIELWNQVIQTNQSGVFYMTRSVVDLMIKNRNRGVIINISSIAAKGNAGQTAYSASKAAVEAMSKVWSKELGAFGIRSIAIAPGFMDTEGAQDAIEEKMLEKWKKQTPLGRTGIPDEVVLAAQFAIENDFFNGEVLKVNGGLVL